MMYDEKNLYVAFKCWDDKDKIRASVAKRDNVYGEDNVRMWIDTYNDQRRAYVLGFNPFGIQQDGMYTEGVGADFSVDIVMESKGVIEDWGWSVEVKIPFKSLRYAAGKGKLWGFNAARNIDRFNDEFDQWLPDDRNVSGFLIKARQDRGSRQHQVRADIGGRTECYGFRDRQSEADDSDISRKCCGLRSDFLPDRCSGSWKVRQ
jgi:hypothetical protein